MTQFSANLGFLWTDRSLPDAIHAAKAAGFHAVECHWPYATPAGEVKLALKETGLPMLGLNTRRGDVAAGENGLCALPDRQEDALDAIAEAVEYAEAIGALAVHVMAGNASGDAAREAFLKNLHVATKIAVNREIDILVEPLNRFDAPGYFLRTIDQARQIIEAVSAPNLKLMFDCYHVGRTEGNIIAQIDRVLPLIGHIQFASVPDRDRPDRGEVDYAKVFAAIAQRGWVKPLGAEYKPGADTDASLGWMTTL